GHVAQNLLDPLHGGSIANQWRVFTFGAECCLTQASVLKYEMALLRSVLDGRHQSVSRVRFGEKIVGAIAHALDCDVDVAMAGDQDDGNVGVYVPNPAKKLQTIHVWHPDVGDDHAIEVGAECREGRSGAAVNINRYIIQPER